MPARSRRTLYRAALRAPLALAVAACAVSCPAAALAQGARAARPARAAVRARDATSATYLALAEQGIGQQSTRWRTSRYGWYCEVLGCGGEYPLLTVWGIVRMFESVDAVALAAPTAAHRSAAQHLAARAESLYWNRYLHGFDPYPGDNYPNAQAWFDDNGWLGLAFFDAYRATGSHRWLRDAQRALEFIAAYGWDPPNGMWWNTQHEHHSGEALAADSLLATLLYSANGDASDLAHARTWIDWANAHDVAYAGLYASQGPHSGIIDYVQGPLIYAQYLLCQATGVSAYCRHAAAQSSTLAHIWGVEYNLAPLYDSIYMQWMMAYDEATGGTHWIEVARANAAEAAHHTPNGDGLWLDAWWGGEIHEINTQPGMFRTMAATTSLYAWLAYYG